MRVGELVDDYLYEVSRKFLPATERKYGQILEKLVEHLGAKTPATEIERTDVTSFLDKWRHAAPATKALHTTIVNNLFGHAVDIGALPEVPGGKPFERPRLPKPEDRDVVTVSLHDVARMFQACESWGDEVCLGLLAYTGARRNAASMLRWRDLTLEPDPPHAPFGWMKLREKGGKVVEKPINGALREILDRADGHAPDDYVVPNFRPNAVRRPERKNDIIYDRVKRIAARAGIQAHVHALRAAFAVFFLEVHRGTLKALQELLGHESLDTTRHYTRGLNRKVLMSEVVDMDWSALSEGGTNGASGVAAHDSASTIVGHEAVLGEPTPSLSALTEGEAGGRREAHLGCRASSVSALRRDMGEHLERVAAHHVLPPNEEEAHTGFEPVLPLDALLGAVQGEDDTTGDTSGRLSAVTDSVPATRGDTA